jgi:transcriptional regulator with XRE-family HTH domain
MAGNKAFGDYIRKLREEKKIKNPNFTLRKFAESVGISPAYLSKVELADFDPPAPDKIKKMAELLEVNADELLALAEKVDPDIPKLIKEQPAMADFLRTASQKGITPEQLMKMVEQSETDKDKK